MAPESGVYDCWAEFYPEWTIPLYITWVTVAIYIIPFCLLAFAYGRICFVVFASMMAKEPSIREPQKNKFSWRSQKSHNGSLSGQNVQNNQYNGNVRSQNCNKPRAHVRGLSRAKVKTVKLTLTVIICYLVCWGPFFVAQMWSAWDPHAPFTGKAFSLHLRLPFCPLL